MTKATQPVSGSLGFKPGDSDPEALELLTGPQRGQNSGVGGSTRPVTLAVGKASAGQNQNRAAHHSHEGVRRTLGAVSCGQTWPPWTPCPPRSCDTSSSLGLCTLPRVGSGPASYVSSSGSTPGLCSSGPRQGDPPVQTRWELEEGLRRVTDTREGPPCAASCSSSFNPYSCPRG